MKDEVIRGRSGRGGHHGGEACTVSTLLEGWDDVKRSDARLGDTGPLWCGEDGRAGMKAGSPTSDVEPRTVDGRRPDRRVGNKQFRPEWRLDKAQQNGAFLRKWPQRLVGGSRKPG